MLRPLFLAGLFSLLIAVGCDDPSSPAGKVRQSRYLPLPMNVEGKDVQTGIYLAAKVDDRPVSIEVAAREGRWRQQGPWPCSRSSPWRRLSCDEGLDCKTRRTTCACGRK